MYGTNTWYTDQVIKKTRAGDEYQFCINFAANLGVGSYSVAIALHDQSTHINANYCWQDLALVFNVVNTGKIQFTGCNWIEPKVDVKLL
jgi:lipopolysaccharide transport system ATP-binding protein